MPLLTDNPHWPGVLEEARALAATSLRDLFTQDKNRFQNLSFRAGSLFLDFSRQRLKPATLARLSELLRAQNFEALRAALFAGEQVNASEGRAALHMALRAEQGASFSVGGSHVMPQVLEARMRMLRFAEDVRRGVLRGATGKAIAHVVAVGIGGSDLGPRLLTEALADGHGPQLHFLMNVDGMATQKVMRALPPEETLVVLASKTFTTAETMQNAHALKAWLAAALGPSAGTHFVALTAAQDKAAAFGVGPEKTFPFWDWVGGRFSVWSSVGLPAALAMGAENFRAFLSGGAQMDAHFLQSPLLQNIPVLLALLSVWNINALGTRARAVLPYAERLSLLPAYLQQLEMESLGKSVGPDGVTLPYATAPVVFGMSGTPAQHAFMQALHQGTEMIPAEFLLVRGDESGLPDHHAMLNANALAQAEALAFGRPAAPGADALALQKGFPGNRPSSLLVLESLSPHVLGQLIAAYEHKVFTESVLWGLNAFDQWGVELGKVLAGPITEALSSSAARGDVPPLAAYLKG